MILDLNSSPRHNLFQDEFGVVGGTIFNIESDCVGRANNLVQQSVAVFLRLHTEGRRRHAEPGCHELVVASHLSVEMVVLSIYIVYMSTCHSVSYHMREINVRGTTLHDPVALVDWKSLLRRMSLRALEWLIWFWVNAQLACRATLLHP